MNNNKIIWKFEDEEYLYLLTDNEKDNYWEVTKKIKNQDDFCIATYTYKNIDREMALIQAKVDFWTLINEEYKSILL